MNADTADRAAEAQADGYSEDFSIHSEHVTIPGTAYNEPRTVCVWHAKVRGEYLCNSVGAPDAFLSADTARNAAYRALDELDAR